MEKRYWLARKRSALGMARGAASAEARLIHYDLAGRYSVKAAQFPPPAPKTDQHALDGERAVLHLPQPEAQPSARFCLPEGEGL